MTTELREGAAVATAAPETQSTGWATPALFTLTAFAGSALLFIVEPMVARMLLPSYGGAATVWATSTLLFQVLLLLGYLYVHGSVRVAARRQPWVHLPLMLVPLILLPVALPSDAAPAADASPVLWLLRTLLLMVGLPFAVLSTTGPLLQMWYSWTGAARSHDPYFLYAASNAGSFIGLLAYPFLVEPTLDLSDQRLLWSWAFVGYVMLTAGCGVVALRARSATRVDATVETHSPKPSRGNVALWLALSFLPSSLMLGVTTHLTTDVASIPLLWVVPLAIYLATFIAAFARSSRTAPVSATQLGALMAIVVLVVNFPLAEPVWVKILVNLVLLGVVGYAAHGRLAASRPSADHLTYFFVVVSIGGALGGLLNGFLAPVVFDRVLEYPLVIIAIPLLMLGLGTSRLVALVLCGALAVGFVAVGLQADEGAVLHQRSFYGSSVVTVKDGMVRFRHGTTLHGNQYQDPKLAGEPTTYYSRQGPVGDLFKAYGDDAQDITVVGLGAGTIATYGRSGQHLTFIEIDPDVIDIAENDSLFTYLSDSAATITTKAGDGRLEVVSAPDSSLDLLVLDAFSSDAIPTHLLTVEAMQDYAAKLRPHGVIAVHITNRLFDLEPVLAGVAKSLGWGALIREDTNGNEYGVASTWAVLAADDADLSKLVGMPGWVDVDQSDAITWTDDHASLLSVLR